MSPNFWCLYFRCLVLLSKMKPYRSMISSTAFWYLRVFMIEKSTEGGEGSDCLIVEVLSVDPCDHGSDVTLTRGGVAADPHLLAGGKVRGKAKAGGVALGHGVCVCVLVSVAWGATPDQSRSLMFQISQRGPPAASWRTLIASARWRLV